MPTANDTTGFNLNRRLYPALLLGTLMASLFATSGCRSTRDNQIDILERELRAQEDYIYELEDYVVEYSDKLRQCRCSQPHVASVTKPTPAPKQTSKSNTRQSTQSTVEKKPARRTLQEPREESILDSVEPASEPAVESEVPVEELEVPELDLEIGEPISSDEEHEAAILADSEGIEHEQDPNTIRIPNPVAYQTAGYDELEESTDIPFEVETLENLDDTEAVAEAETQSPSVRKAERLVIAYVFRDSTESPKPSSLLSVIEARDSRNEPAAFDGKVSLMVMQGDPEAPTRIKRWDFTEEETAAAWQTSQFGDGLHLELPLEDTQLPEGPFELWVRLESADGGKLLSQIPMEAQTLATMEDVDVEQMADGALESPLGETEEAEIASINPLRSGNKKSVSTTPLASVDSASKAEPQWRAATHFSSGANSGFSTTATEKKWNISTTPIPRDSQPASTTAGKQRWTSRR
ncbi:hypothetical protein [Bythopirellula goksoeyrii]|uniref:Uncharacterized protein n=1 Tax=Bythopirellula goksoeyrii TaxID=1400387 RepID=A0A5B9QB05_9BACT|nr:hypothetical protein [Bythopirellula goksoeyrii]QEG34939.1 hypothetical protein Pr1d_22280 [Bythopirellula goksoeyrii]